MLLYPRTEKIGEIEKLKFPKCSVKKKYALGKLEKKVPVIQNDK